MKRNVFLSGFAIAVILWICFWLPVDLFAQKATSESAVASGGLVDRPTEGETVKKNLYGLNLDEGAEMVMCRSLPFMACAPEKRGNTKRIMEGDQEIIPVGVQADTVYLLGMINEGWDMGVAHWGEPPELRTVRDDQICIGSRIGDVDIVKVRKQYPGLQILGGIPKSEITQGPARIDEILMPVEEVLKTGGYVPFGDHFIPPDVDFKNFTYYRRKLNQLIDKYGK